MIVVSDNTCLTHLTRAGLLGVLPSLFESVWVPAAVAGEYKTAHGVLPSWIRAVEVSTCLDQTRPLDAGEAEAITLAYRTRHTLIIDERKGRRVARALDVDIVGTLGVLEQSYQQNHLLDLPDAINRLVATDFYIHERIIEEVLRRNGLA